MSTNALFAANLQALGGTPAPGPLSKQAKKRARRLAAQAQAVQDDFFDILRLSPEILDSILSYAHPGALVRLIWTCKRFASQLLSRKSAPIWTAARIYGAESVPICPEDVSELRWAYLLFGPSECYTCEEMGVRKIVFAFRRRVCPKCATANQLLEPEAGAFVHVLSLVPHIYTWNSTMPAGAPLVKIYWRPDVERMLERFDRLDDEEKAELQKQASLVVDDAEEQVAWAVRVLGNQELRPEPTAEEQTLIDAHVVYVQETLIAEARWDSFFISRLDGSQWLDGPPAQVELSAAAWDALRPQLEGALRTIYIGWLRSASRDRMPVARQLYIDLVIANKVPPAEWYILPAVDDILKTKEARDVHVVEEVLDVQIARWCQDHLHDIARRHVGLVAPAPTREEERRVENQIQELHHANVVYACPSPTAWCGGRQTALTIQGVTPRDGVVPFCGLREALLHERRHREMRVLDSEPAEKVELEVSARGSTAADAVLDVAMANLGLDLREKSPQDVDKALDKARFVCATCVERDPKGLGRVAMDWRRCISHFLEVSEEDHPVPSFRVVEGVFGLRGARQKDVNALKLSRDWACALCDAHCFNWQPLDAVLKHIHQYFNHIPYFVVSFLFSDRHPDVRNPNEDEHYLWAGSTPRALPAPLLTGTVTKAPTKGKKVDGPDDQPHKFSCVKCENTKKKSGSHFKGVEAVLDHLLAVHKVLKDEAKEKKHYRRVVTEM
ncbi:hypothetical protein EXIGLDRAFT_747896 [Exidia glandulosa HHB12029]|uniref:F-box domain-containing protein n=1 Tax=Exidia glandulosa HHB12029 TaxID=1314781 RepID=A0A166AX22_EXIGL|nr:hypothetical protein EXIGLDRAFT_747896 [Exidia glandulosa HHB12029]